MGDDRHRPLWLHESEAQDPQTSQSLSRPSDVSKRDSESRVRILTCSPSQPGRGLSAQNNMLRLAPIRNCYRIAYGDARGPRFKPERERELHLLTRRSHSSANEWFGQEFSSCA